MMYTTFKTNNVKTQTRSKTRKLKMQTHAGAFFNLLRNTMNSSWITDFYKAAGIYFLWIFLHWCSVQAYQYFCAPLSFWGLFFGASFASQMPHCRGALWLLNFTHQSVTQMWVFLGIWISTRVMSIATKKTE